MNVTLSQNKEVIAALSDKLAQQELLTAALNETLRKIRDEIDEVNTKNKVLNDTVQGQRDEINDLKTKHNELNATLSQKIQQNENEIDTMKSNQTSMCMTHT